MKTRISVYAWVIALLIVLFISIFIPTSKFDELSTNTLIFSFFLCCAVFHFIQLGEILKLQDMIQELKENRDKE